MLLRNSLPTHQAALLPADAALLGRVGADEAWRVLTRQPNYAPTPLRALPALARELGVGALLVKDEGSRFGLGSFKALGGAYAVIRLTLDAASAQLGRDVDADEVHTPDVRAVAARMTFACATDGNHGRSVAQGAALVGGRAAIFVHGGVSAARVAAIASFGADVVRVDGAYDDSVAEAARVSAERGWVTVADTSRTADERVPGLVVQGYTVLVRELAESLAERPTHVFVQAGVGGLAAAVAAHLADVYGPDRPMLAVVEPARAACVYASVVAGRPTRIPQGEPTVMAMLECYEPSAFAWRILERAADAFLTVEESDAVAAMNRLARPTAGDPAIVAGESGAAGIAGVMWAARSVEARAGLGLDGTSRVVVINTEGATDPACYRALVGMDPAAVVASQTARAVRDT